MRNIGFFCGNPGLFGGSMHIYFRKRALAFLKRDLYFCKEPYVPGELLIYPPKSLISARKEPCSGSADAFDGL